MLNLRILEWRMTEERLKAELIEVERECASIVDRFEQLDRTPTEAEREQRRLDFLATRKRLGQLDNQLLELKCARL